MSIVKMKRLRLLALASDRDTLLQRLMHVGSVEITEPDAKLSDPEWSCLLHRDSTSLGEMKTLLTGTQSAIATLSKYTSAKTGFLVIRQEVKESELFDPVSLKNSLEKASTINEHARQIAQLYSQENRNTANRMTLAPWSSLDVPLDLKSTENVQFQLCVCPSETDFGQMHAALVAAASAVQLDLISSDREQHYMFLINHAAEAEAVMETLKPYGLSIVQFKELSGTARENIQRLDVENEKIVSERDAHIAAIGEMKDCLQALNICVDRLTQEIAKQTARESFLTNDTILFLEGWVTVPELSRLEGVLGEFACAYEFSDPEPEDTVPTKLHNSKLVTPLNMVTEMYSLPAYNGVDPNPLIFPFFTIFFGMMYCDIAYGVILIALSLFVAKKYKPKGTLGHMMGLATMCGVTTLFFGILTGSLCGNAVGVITEDLLHIDRVELMSVINPLINPMGVLYIAIAMGAVQIIMGMCVKIYICVRDGRPLDALFDVGSWWLVFAGIAVYATGNGPWILLAGVLALILTQGRARKGIFGKLFGGIASLYDITSYLSDILSYTRLMALMLATSVIANVVNLLGALPGSIIVFIPIFLFGHAFNMGINIIGTYVHAARLQYLEFFSKFYISGGVPFRPLAYNTKYVDIIEEEK